MAFVQRLQALFLILLILILLLFLILFLILSFFDRQAHG